MENMSAEKSPFGTRVNVALNIFQIVAIVCGGLVFGGKMLFEFAELRTDVRYLAEKVQRLENRVYRLQSNDVSKFSPS